jgi:hypothetical protein
MVIATDDDLPSERGSPIVPSNCSSPPAFRKGVALSPIDEPELDDTTDTVDCDSLVSDPERASGVERDNEEFPNLPIRTDEWKLYKVKHAGATYFLKADKAQFSPECLPEKSMEISLVRNLLITNVCHMFNTNFLQMECRGCRFKMPDVTSTHKCVANFCSLCQLATDNMQLHVLEHHSKNLTTCPFCQEDTSSLQMLEVHLSRHTQLKIRPSVCIGCKVKFMTSEGRIGHSCSSTLICQNCNTIFPSEEKLSNHQESQHKKVPTLPSEAISEQETNFETDGKVDGENDMGYVFSILFLLNAEETLI